MPYAMSNHHCQQSGDDSPTVKPSQVPSKQGTVVPPVVTRTTAKTVMTTVTPEPPPTLEPPRATPTLQTIVQTTITTFSGSGDCPFDDDDGCEPPTGSTDPPPEGSGDDFLVTDDEDIKGSPYIYESREPARRPIMETKNIYEDLPSYEIKLFVSQNVQGEQLLESVSDDVKRIFQSMIPNIREVNFKILFGIFIMLNDSDSSGQCNTLF